MWSLSCSGERGFGYEAASNQSIVVQAFGGSPFEVSTLEGSTLEGSTLEINKLPT